MVVKNLRKINEWELAKSGANDENRAIAIKTKQTNKPVGKKQLRKTIYLVEHAA